MPSRFDAFGFDNFGYANNVILPVALTGHISLERLCRSDMEALVCSDICVPLTGQLALDLPNDGLALPSAHAQAMAQLCLDGAARPADPQGAATGPLFRIATADIRNDGLFVAFGDESPAVKEIFVEGLKSTTFKAPVAQAGGFFMAAVPAELPDLNGRDLTLTVSAPPEQWRIPHHHWHRTQLTRYSSTIIFHCGV